MWGYAGASCRTAERAGGLYRFARIDRRSPTRNVACDHDHSQGAGQTEEHIQDYQQFHELCQALSASPHDIVYLTGDVHFGRVASAPLQSGKTLYEVIASPMSLVEDTDGDASYVLAKATWPSGRTGPPYQFPPFTVSGVQQNPITYLEAIRAHPLDPTRTAENFVTIKFEKSAVQTGAIVATIDAWLPRRDSDRETVFKEFRRRLLLT